MFFLFFSCVSSERNRTKKIRQHRSAENIRKYALTRRNGFSANPQRVKKCISRFLPSAFFSDVSQCFLSRAFATNKKLLVGSNKQKKNIKKEKCSLGKKSIEQSIICIETIERKRTQEIRNQGLLAIKFCQSVNGTPLPILK